MEMNFFCEIKKAKHLKFVPGFVRVSKQSPEWSVSWVDSQQGQEIFFFSQTSRPDVGPTQLSIQWALELLSGGKATHVCR